MPLPLLVKAAAIGGAAYVATRWIAEQRRQRIHRVSVYPTSATQGAGSDDVPAENHPGEAPLAPGVAAGPTS